MLPQGLQQPIQSTQLTCIKHTHDANQAVGGSSETDALQGKSGGQCERLIASAITQFCLEGIEISWAVVTHVTDTVSPLCL